MNTGNLALGFQSVLAAEFLLSKTALVLREFDRICRGVARIAGFKTVRGDKQILDAHVNADLFIGNGQQRRLKFAQAGDKITSCVVFGNGNGGRVRRQRLTPCDSQRLIALRQFQFPVAVAECPVSEFSRLTVFFGFKDRVFRPTFKEVFERGLLVSQALLQRHTGNVIQEGGFRQLFDGGQTSIRVRVTDYCLRLIVGIRAVTQDAVVDETHTAKGLRQQHLLLRVGVKPESVGAFDFHGSQCRQKSCEFLLKKVANDERRRE